jgi:predicted PurR-regulated permease PerM
MFAFIIAYILDPFIDLLQRIKIPKTNLRLPRPIAIGMMILLLLCFVGWLLLFLIPQTLSEVSYLAGKLPALKDRLLQLIIKVETIEIPTHVQRILDTIVEKTQEGLLSFAEKVPFYGIAILKSMFKNLMSFLGFILNLIVFFVLTIYLLNDFDRLKRSALDVIPLAYQEKVLDTVSRIDSNLRAFFRGQLFICVILALIYCTGLSIIGLNSALLIGLIGGFSNLIPYFGIFIGLVPASILSLVEFQSLFHLFLVIGIFIIGQLIETAILTPKIIGKGIGIHPILIILAIMICGKVLGLFGVLFAVPLLAVLKVGIELTVEHFKSSESKAS